MRQKTQLDLAFPPTAKGEARSPGAAATEARAARVATESLAAGGPPMEAIVDFARYADDCNIYVRSRRAGERVMANLERFLARRLKLKVNAAKSAVDPPSRRKFLGSSFTAGKEPRRRIAPPALARVKSRVRELTRRTRGAGLAPIVEELSRYLGSVPSPGRNGSAGANRLSSARLLPGAPATRDVASYVTLR